MRNWRFGLLLCLTAVGAPHSRIAAQALQVTGELPTFLAPNAIMERSPGAPSRPSQASWSLRLAGADLRSIP